MAAYFRFVLIFIPILAVALVFAAASPAPVPETVKVPIGEAAPERLPSAEERAFEARLGEIGSSISGEVGIAVIDVENGYAYHSNGDRLMPQQSVSKLWVAMAALAKVDAGELDLTERVSIRRADLTLFYQPIRNIVRTRGSFSSDYDDLIERALASSDNTANDRVLRRIGGAEAVQDWLDDVGLDMIQFGADERTKQSAIAGLHWDQSYSYGDMFYRARDVVPQERRREAFEAYLGDPIDGASALGIAYSMAQLARGELLSEASTHYLRNTLSRTRSGPRRLKGGLAEGWGIEHKTGTGQVFDGEQSGYNDVGLLIAPDGTEYGVAVLIGRTRESIPARMEMMQAVTRAVAEFHRNRAALDGDNAA
ncbi:serine hydrolase [Erythrobacter rubeus]|uniref:beta-lactamase n=1 Tax=Erythrobacter rubeus TaxID=2760803 RepID=A0ABR8KM80_9SPHN|nr:serine hydrolase [Erythrobacter rubeus]MBD2841611.1 serine hydrolase [Erythrobacter rubeus]